MRLRLLLGLMVLGLWQTAAQAEHAKIELTVTRVDSDGRDTNNQAAAAADVEPPAGGLNARPLLKVKAKELLVLQFFYTNTYPHGVLKAARVHYFVVREDKARQKTVPNLKEGVVTEGRFTLNFKPKARVGARVSFTISKPGVYLLRVQSENTQSDHEHFSAIDIQVE